MNSKPYFAKRAVSLALCGVLTTMPLSANTPKDASTTTPIKHVVVIFQENRSFDQYFGSYPKAANLPGENPFYPLPNSPSVNNLQTAGLHESPDQAQTQISCGELGWCYVWNGPVVRIVAELERTL